MLTMILNLVNYQFIYVQQKSTFHSNSIVRVATLTWTVLTGEVGQVYYAFIMKCNKYTLGLEKLSAFIYAVTVHINTKRVCSKEVKDGQAEEV